MFAIEHVDSCSLLSVQEERSFNWKRQNSSLSSNAYYAICIDGLFDMDSLEASISMVCKRHEAFRTHFSVDAAGGFCRVVLASPGTVPIQVINLEESPLAEEQANKIASDICMAPFLASDDVDWFRFVVINIGSRRAILALSMAHLVSDAYSLNFLLKELWALYSSKLTWTDKQPHFCSLSDFVASQRAWLNTADFTTSLEKCLGTLKREFEIIRNNFNDGPDGFVARHVRAEELRVDAASQARLRALSLSTGASFPAILIAISGLVIARLFATTCFFIATPFSNRKFPGAESVAGFISNTVLVPFLMDEAATIAELASVTHRKLFSALRFGHIPFGSVSHGLLGESQTGSVRNGLNAYMVNIHYPGSELVGEDGTIAQRFPLLLGGHFANDIEIVWKLVEDALTLRVRFLDESRDGAAEKSIDLAGALHYMTSGSSCSPGEYVRGQFVAAPACS